MKNGFTLIEILISMAILLILSGIVFVSFSGLRENKILDNAVELTVFSVKQARSETLFSKNASQYGVHFKTNGFVLFKGDVFSELAVDNVEITLDSSVEIIDILLNGGGSDIVFERLTGETGNFGTISFRLKNNLSKVKIITINQSGVVDF